jgi:hypothetical protein
MNTKSNNAGQLSQDQLDQQELDRAFNEMNGIKPEDAAQTPEPQQEEVLDDILPANEGEVDTTNDDLLTEVSEEAQEKPEGDVLEDDEKKDEAKSDDYVDLENSPIEDDETLIKPDDPVGVQKRIGKEVQRRKVLEAEIAQMKAQQEQLMRMVMGQTPNSVVPGMMPTMQPNVAQQQQQVPFVPPPLPKPYEEMNEFERFEYFNQVKVAEAQAKQMHSQQQVQQQRHQADLGKVLNQLRQNLDDPVINELYTKNGGNLTEHMLAPLVDYKNAASLIRYFHVKHNAELALLATKPPHEQARGIVRLAERVNLERRQSFEKKANAKKPVPAGKTTSAAAPKAFAKKDIYSDQALLEKAAGNPKLWDQLIAKGY